ncbi:ATP-binding cassette domain-containing protein [Clostridium sp. AF19-22AC]|jgi:ABC-type sugar transport system ATPase subunit|uniref:sugar ABC transporter ATP-binding protein n=1 Tax=Clostridia TaxID=186801 RepID=UPI000E494B91|nr:MULTISPECIES: ATP-binding cassette domain-containing protein [Clostridia]RHR31287.1 ATP-binding cassette domain-containing protein [Clostridium sp. AF19-22AC]
MEDYILEMQNITKEFPGVKALDDVTFCVKKGEIHSLVGENGAGKSTLMKVLSGVYPVGQYTGIMKISGKEQEYNSVKDSERAGVSIIYQELGLVGTMTICENVFLGNEIVKKGHIDWDAQNRRCVEMLKRVNLDEKPNTVVETLGTGKQQLIEIAKALNKNVDILILDEPTSSLTEQDSKNLLDLLKQLRESGMTCIYISHKLNEVKEISDTVTVLRDGRTITTRPIGELDENKMISYMVGREMTDVYPAKTHTPGEEVLFEVRGWTVPTRKNPEKNLLDQISISVRKGEIVGISGLMGAGRTEFAMSLFGAWQDKPCSGEIYFKGKKRERFRHPREAIDSGLMYLSEDRKRFGLLLNSDLKVNMTLSSLNKISKGGVIDLDLETEQAMQGVKDLSIKTPSVLQLAKNLSGGNQQKVLIVKALLTKPDLLILDEPTRGIDVGSKYEIYQLMDKMAKDGISIIMISSELPEVINMSDRVYVMSDGKIAGEFDTKESLVTQETLLQCSTGK